MSTIKVPIFGGLVTNADPEDLKKTYTPHTHNFDISEVGTLKRREISTKVTQQTDRGFDSMFLFRNPNLALGGGAEWLIYCSQRGIIYRMDRFYNDFLLDSYSDNVRQYNASNADPGNDFLYFIPNEQEAVPEYLSFQPFGDYVLVGFGHNFEPKIIQAINNRKQFLGAYTKATGVYIENFHRGYPETYTLTSAFDTTFGTLADGNYRYNFVPIYDGVNEVMLDEAKSVQRSVTGGNGQANVSLSLVNDIDDMPCSLTGYRVYRATIVGNAKPAYRAIKTVNLLTPAGANDTLISSATCFAGRHIIHSPEGFPTPAEIVELWNEKYPNGEEYPINVAQMTNNVGKRYKFDIFKKGEQGDTFGASNTAYTEKTCDRTGATGYFGGAINGSNVSSDILLDFHYWDSYTIDKDPSGEFLYFPQLLIYYNSEEDGNVDEDGASNWWTALTGDTILIRVSRQNLDASFSSETLNIFVQNSYMGKDKIYSHNEIFQSPGKYNGETANLQYIDKSGNSDNINENIYLHGKKFVMFSLDSNGDPSADIEALTLDYNAPSSSSNQVQENDIDLFQITDSGNLSQTYVPSTGALTIGFTDKGEADGSLAKVPDGTITDLRWLYSENHGGRMFVGNVLLDPSGINEYYPDMINFSEAGMPATIPIINFIRIRDPEGGGVQGLKSMGDSLIVFMEYGIYRLRIPSIDPSSYSVLESNEFIGCVAPRSIVKVEDKVYFCGNNNIYAIDASFNITPIGSSILNKWVAETEKVKTIASYDPIKEVVLFRFGRVKPDLYEFNIRTGEWNKIQTQGNVSSMAVGEEGYLHYGDNSFLDITRSDGNDNDQDEPDSPDPGDGDDIPGDPNDPDSGIDLYDNTWDDTDAIVQEHNQNSALFSAFTFRNLSATSGSNILTGWNPTTGINAGQSISGYGLPEGTTVSSTNASNNNIDVSANSTQTTTNPPFASYQIVGHDNSNTFFGVKEFNSGDNGFRYKLADDDFESSNQKLSAGYFCDEDYIFVRIVNDNINRPSLSQSRQLVKGELLRIDKESYESTPQVLKFDNVYDEVTNNKIHIYFFQNQLNGETVNNNIEYVYTSGDFAEWGMGTDLPYHNEGIVVLKWKNSSYTQQNMVLLQTTLGKELFLKDVYNWRKWVDIKPDANSDQDEGEDSSNFVLPTIQTVNTSDATADSNGSGDAYNHFPYWSRLTDHGTEYNSYSGNSSLPTIDTASEVSGYPHIVARHMGQIQHSQHKFGGGNVNYTFEHFHIYQLDENSTASYRQYRPIKNVNNEAYYAEVAYAIIYRLIDIEGNDEDYESAVQAPYGVTNSALLDVKHYGFDPMLEEQVELIWYYPTATVQPEQAIVPVGGWLEKGVEQ